MNSLKLSDKWDLTLGPGHNLAIVTDTERVVQDVASYERVFKGEEWYNITAGVPYLDRELAFLPPPELVIERANRRAKEVPGVVTATTTLTKLDKRVLSGIIRVTTIDNKEVEVVF